MGVVCESVYMGVVLSLVVIVEPPVDFFVLSCLERRRNVKALSSTSVFPWEREEGRGTESFLIRIRMNAGNGGRGWCER